MTSHARIFPVFALFLIVVSVPNSSGQWPSDPMVNLGVAVRPGEQDQAKVRAASGGGCYISWYDNDPSGSPPFGYDVRLQRLDAAGNPAWAAGGILIADLGFDWTQDYGLDVDAQGNALLAFLDDRFAPDIQVTAAKVDPNGNQVWGPTSVQVTSGSSDKFNPKIAAASDGFIVVAWANNNDVMLQRLDASGVPQWGAGVVIVAPADGFYSVSDLHAGEGGTAIVSWIHSANGGQFLYADKVSPAGSCLWGAGLHVYDAGSLQMGNRPPFVADGSGGAAFGWYSVFPAYQVYAQHILSDGTEAFPPNGSEGSINDLEGRVEGSVSFNPSASETFLFWREEGAGLQGLYGQKFDDSGARRWNRYGVPVTSLGTVVITDIQNQQIGSGAMVGWVADPVPNPSQVTASLVDGNGDIVCAPFPVSSSLSAKYRMGSDSTPAGSVIFVWTDGRNDGGDIYAQKVNGNCSLGITPPREVSPPGAAQPLVFRDKVTLLWEDKALSGSETFNLYRGLLSDLPSGRYGDCLQFGLAASTAVDSEFPSAGTAFFYHVTGKNAAGEGPMGKASDGTPRTPAAACP